MQDIPYGYCYCGCGEKAPVSPQTVRKLGYAKGEPRRYIRNHHKRGTGPKYKIDENGCWIFTGYIGKNGYGQMRPHGSKRMHAAHRVFYEQAKGPIPEGKQLDHLCRNRACVNPDHLEPVTNFENQRRGHKPKLTAEAIGEIRDHPGGYGAISALAAKFNVHASTVHRVRSGQNWSQI